MTYKFGPRKPVLDHPGLAYRVRTSPYGYVVKLYKGAKRLGHVQSFYMLSKDSVDRSCGRSYAEVPQNDRAKAQYVATAHLEEAHRGQGLGRGCPRNGGSDGLWNYLPRPMEQDLPHRRARALLGILPHKGCRQDMV